MPRLSALSLRRMVVRRVLVLLIGATTAMTPHVGGSWDEPDPTTDSQASAELLILLTELPPFDSTIALDDGSQEATLDNFMAVGQSNDCVQLWLAYINAIVQVEIAQANLAKVQAAVEKCLERRKASASSAAVEPTNALFELSGDPLFSVAGDENPAVEYSVLD